MGAFRNFVAAAAGVLSVAGGVIAQAAAPAAPAPSEESVIVSQSRILCVHQDAPTGSRIGAKNVCHTIAEWRDIRANAEQDMLYMQERYDNAQQGKANAAGQ